MTSPNSERPYFGKDDISRNNTANESKKLNTVAKQHNMNKRSFVSQTIRQAVGDFKKLQ